MTRSTLALDRTALGVARAEVPDGSSEFCSTLQRTGRRLLEKGADALLWRTIAVARARRPIGEPARAASLDP